MKKILILGSAGFLMSNLIRYMLYRTKDYDFVSVDSLRNYDDFHKVYLHRKHSFHIGDAGDKEFINRLVWIEDPDVIIISTTMLVPPHSAFPNACAGINEALLPTVAVCGSARPSSAWRRPYIIRLVPDLDINNMGSRAMWNFIESIVIDNNGTVLRLPLCFGCRGNGWFEEGLRMAIVKHLNIEQEFNREPKRYAYAEDIASMIWFLVEHPQIRKIIQMPALAEITPFEMISLSSSVHGSGIQLDKHYIMEKSSMEWIPDSESIKEAVIKTAKWYTINKWIFNNVA